MPNRDDRYRVNNEIEAREVRLIDEEGGMLGNYSLPQALQLATDRGLDLIEVAPNAKPPTCKLMDYGKWKYENKKKQQVSKKKQAVVNIKEIQLRPRTDQGDLDVKLRHARRFLLEGAKVKVNLRFMGREMAHQELGLALLEKVTKQLEDIAVVEQPAKRDGRQMNILMAPDPQKIKDYMKQHPPEESATSAPSQ